MSLKNIVISTLAGIGLAGTLACGDVHNPYESANGDNSGSSSGSCGNSPFVGRYLWAMEGCEIGTTTPISPSTCQARLEGDVREGCYMSVDGTSIHLTCDGEYWGRISTQQVPGCPGYFFFIEAITMYLIYLKFIYKIFESVEAKT